MDPTYYLQSAQEAGGEVLEPVSTWGGRMSSGAISFFSAEDVAGFPISDVATYFSEAMRLSDPVNLKSGLANMHSIVRGSIGLYAALATAENTSNLAELMKFRDTVMCDKAASLLSGVMCRFPGKFTAAQVKACADYGGTETGKLDVLANLLKCADWRATLFAASQMRVLSGTSSSSVPTMYKALMCIWLVSFNKDVEIPTSVIASINEILKGVRTEKVIRIALMAVENLLAKKAMCEEMAEQETMALVSSLEYEKWRDAELYTLIKKLCAQLQQEVKILTNFERFEREVTSGRLKWGFIHSEKFWLENVLKCESNNFRVVDHLMVIIRTSKDAETLAVACHDLGEFARLHPVGKHIATQRGAKDKMLELMSNSQREVAREALLCVQKLMLQGSGLSAMIAAQG